MGQALEWPQVTPWMSLVRAAMTSVSHWNVDLPLERLREAPIASCPDLAFRGGARE